MIEKWDIAVSPRSNLMVIVHKCIAETTPQSDWAPKGYGTYIREYNKCVGCGKPIPKELLEARKLYFGLLGE